MATYKAKIEKIQRQVGKHITYYCRPGDLLTLISDSLGTCAVQNKRGERFPIRMIDMELISEELRTRKDLIAEGWEMPIHYYHKPIL